VKKKIVALRTEYIVPEREIILSGVSWATYMARLERILTMVYVVQSYWACFGLYSSSCMWKTKNTTTFRRLHLSPFSGGWGRINLLRWAR
jgi:hypothetical protein